MAENEYDANEDLKREHVLERQPGSLRVTLNDVLAASKLGEGHDRIDHDGVQQAYS